ncbi:hypothetical protein T492DRAFT_1118947, partial [Pavlovales sp. CCMP2436]
PCSSRSTRAGYQPHLPGRVLSRAEAQDASRDRPRTQEQHGVDRTVMEAFVNWRQEGMRGGRIQELAGGNRAHVLLDLIWNMEELDTLREQCTKWFKQITFMETLDAHLRLDDSTAYTRVLRSAVARSPKAHLRLVRAVDRLRAWQGERPQYKGMTVGGWIRTASMR